MLIDDAKLGHKKADRKRNPIGVEFSGEVCREVLFSGSFGRKWANPRRVFGSFGEFYFCLCDYCFNFFESIKNADIQVVSIANADGRGTFQSALQRVSDEP